MTDAAEWTRISRRSVILSGIEAHIWNVDLFNERNSTPIADVAGGGDKGSVAWRMIAQTDEGKGLALCSQYKIAHELPLSYIHIVYHPRL